MLMMDSCLQKLSRKVKIPKGQIPLLLLNLRRRSVITSTYHGTLYLFFQS